MHTLHHGDVLSVLPTLDPQSFDAVLCDPPYGLKFMGKAWDHGVPGEPVWSLVREALKPGAHLLAFGGTRTEHRLVCAIEDAGFEIRDKVMWLYAQGFPKSHNLDGAFKGYGTALKPAYEPCVVAMKPLDGTFAANAASHGVAGLWIDGGRVGTEGGTKKTHTNERNNPSVSLRGGVTGGLNGGRVSDINAGRWPANLILDAEAAAMLGAPARYFYTAKASTRERNAGLEDLPGKQLAGHNKWTDCDYRKGNGEVTAKPKQNHHPTLKPIDLCRYLATLILPPKRDTPRRLLVPFSGSGSEMIGALLAGWDEVVGIEREREYIDIAERRIQHWTSK